jgi:hypothetical protein
MARKSKFMPTTQQRQEAARYVVYELWMLRECANMPTPRTQTEKNVLYEGLARHARALRDFFFTKSNKGQRVTHDTDIVAADYFTDSTAWPHTSAVLPTYLGAHKERMDGTLAHLSFQRLKYAGTRKEWDRQSIRTEIGDIWLKFIKELQDRKELAAAWFQEWARKQNVPVASPF